VFERRSDGGPGLFSVPQTRELFEHVSRLESRGVPHGEAFRCAVLAAAGGQRDGFVTARDYLLVGRAQDPPGVLTADEAFAIIGLALRRRGNRSIGRDLPRYGATGFHFVLMRDVLRSAWRWFSGCVANRAATGSPAASDLGETAMRRFMRVLQVRDRLHEQAKVWQTDEIAEELIFNFETLLLFLSGAFDAAAGVAHLAHIPNAREEPGWRRPGWRKRLTTVAPSLAALTDDGTPGTTVLQLIGRLRNTIHREAFRPIVAGNSTSSGPEYVVELQAREAAELHQRVTALGDDTSAWGLRALGGREYLAVDRYTEALLPRAARLLNDLIAGTQVERLPGVTPASLMVPPPDIPSAKLWQGDFFAYQSRHRIRRLAGL